MEKVIILNQRKLGFGVCIVFTTLVQLANAEVPAIFIFGDSTADVGTNNHLKGCNPNATADNPFYGIDYPNSKPTGRFSNGHNTADLIVRLLGDYQESPPPFLALKKHKSSFKSKILRGVNFASGGSGLLDRTGSALVVVPLARQIQQFATVRKAIIEVLGDAKGEHLLSNSLYLISAGSNDFFEYELIYRSHNISESDLFIDLNNNYAKHLENLYNMGARKFGIVGVPPIGCVPALRAKTGGFCLDDLNRYAQTFYNSTLSLLDNFRSNFGVKYSLGNTYQMTMNIIDNAQGSGFENVKEACCGVGSYYGEGKCSVTAEVCLDHDKFLFWDWFHPTQAACQLAARTLVFAEGREFVTPMNFNQLANSDV